MEVRRETKDEESDVGKLKESRDLDRDTLCD